MLFNLKKFRRTQEDNKDSLNILPEVVVEILIEYFIPSDDKMDYFVNKIVSFLEINISIPKI